ncbi:putative proteasome inhibitor isoform X2 [Wolffia australiana]
MATEISVMAVIRASRPIFRNSHDKAAFALHAAFMAAGYSLTATGKPALAGTPPQGVEEVGIEGWNDLENSYGFVYAKGKTSTVLVKCLPVGDVLAVDALILESDQKEPFNLQINVKEFVSDEAVSGGNYERVYRNFNRLVESFNSGILNELEPPPKPKIAASSPTSESGEALGQSTSFTEPQPYSPLVYPPVPSPGFDDVHPGPGAGFYPLRGRPGDGSMLVGPHDPRFGRLDRPELGYPGGVAGIPPGARYDPIGPPDVPGFEPGRFIRLILYIYSI